MPRKRRGIPEEAVDRLVAWRVRARVQASEVAAKLGIEQPTLSNYENKRRGFPEDLVEPYLRAVYELARAVRSECDTVRLEIADKRSETLQ